MLKTHHVLTILTLVLISTMFGGCSPAQDEAIRENVRVPGLQESVQARDRSLETAVEGNIMSDLVLRWYAQEYGITVEVSTAVASVYMKVKTEELHQRALDLARGTDGVQDVIDNIDVDSSLPDAPFEW